MATGAKAASGAITRTVNIDSDLSSKEYYLVNLDTTDDNVVNIAADASAPMFVLEQGGDGSSTATRGTIVVGGLTKVKTGGAVVAGNPLTSDASGTAVATTTDTNFVFGIAMENGDSGDIVEVLVAPSMYAG